MKNLKVEDENYTIDEGKFLLAINNGEVFKTTHGEAGIYKQGGAVYFKQAFNYRFDTEFILNNKEKLISLGIISIKRKRILLSSKETKNID